MTTSTDDSTSEPPKATDLRTAAADFTWLLDRFATETAGVVDAIAVSSDGLLIAVSQLRDRADSERLAAIVSGITSLAAGVSGNYALGASTRSSSTWKAATSSSPPSATAPCSASSPPRRRNSATSPTR